MAIFRHVCQTWPPTWGDPTYPPMRKLGRQDVLVLLTTSPQARKKWPQLPETVEACMLTRSINGKERQVLTSMIEPMRFPGADIVELYGHRWEIELGYREMKHSLQQHQLTLRSKKAACGECCWRTNCCAARW